MPSICLCFEIHQPMRLKHFPGSGDDLKDEHLIEHFINNGLNKFVFDRAATKCYYPTTQILLELVDTFKNQKREFKFAFNVSGVWVEQCEKWHPDLLDLFKQLVKSKRVEVLGSTYYHSLASLFRSHEEFVEQVKMQNEMVKNLLGVRPRIFINTEMIYNNLIAKTIEDLGYKAIFTEGVDRILEWRSPNYVYARGPIKEDDIPLKNRIKVLLRNYRLSDDIGYRFSSREWDQWPLTAEKYAIWLSSTPGQLINIFMDYETFGEHHSEQSGIFFFLRALPWKVFDWENLEFRLPSEIVKRYKAVGEIDVHEFNTISWADMERDASAWLGNTMQTMAFEEIKKLESIVKQNGNHHLVRLWRLLQQSDHLYYMCTKWWSDGDVHKHFSPYSTPHDAFVNMISGLSEIKVRMAKELGKIEAIKKTKRKKKKIKDKKEPIKKKIKVKIRKPKRKKLKQEINLKPELLTVEKSKKKMPKPKSELGPKLLREMPIKSQIESILKEVTGYPNVSIDFRDIRALSKELDKRVK